MKKHHKPDPRQQSLLSDKRLMYEIMWETRFEGASKIALLCKLFIRIGGFDCRRISVDELGERIGQLSTKTVHRIKKQLEDEGLIFAKPVRGQGGVYDWSIGWANLWDAHQRWKQAEAAAERVEDVAEESIEDTAEALAGPSAHLTSETARLIHETASRVGDGFRLTDETACLTGETACLTSETACLTSETHIRNSVLESFLNSSSSSSTEADERDALVMMVKDAGVGQFSATVKTALDRGLTIEQARDVVAHFHAHPGRWSAGVLVERLTRLGANLLDAAEGWYGDSPEWLAARNRAAAAITLSQLKEADMPRVETPHEKQTRLNREAKYGPILDAMSPAEQKAALAELLAKEPASIPFALRCGLSSGLYRDRLLVRMEQRDAAAREDRQRRAQMLNGFAYAADDEGLDDAP